MLKIEGTLYHEWKEKAWGHDKIFMSLVLFTSGYGTTYVPQHGTTVGYAAETMQNDMISHDRVANCRAGAE